MKWINYLKLFQGICISPSMVKWDASQDSFFNTKTSYTTNTTYVQIQQKTSWKWNEIHQSHPTAKKEVDPM